MEEVRAAVRGVRPAVMAHRLREALDADVTADLATVAVPTLCLAGASDRLVGLRGLAPIAARVPGLSTVVLDGPHLLLQARPEASAREVLRFLGGT